MENKAPVYDFSQLHRELSQAYLSMNDEIKNGERLKNKIDTLKISYKLDFKPFEDAIDAYINKISEAKKNLESTVATMSSTKLAALICKEGSKKKFSLSKSLKGLKKLYTDLIKNPINVARIERHMNKFIDYAGRELRDRSLAKRMYVKKLQMKAEALSAPEKMMKALDKAEKSLKESVEIAEDLKHMFENFRDNVKAHKTDMSNIKW